MAHSHEYIEGWGHKIFSDRVIGVCESCGVGIVVDEPMADEIDRYYEDI